MNNRANPRRFRPGLYSTLATLLIAPLFAGLGYWQLQRAAEKVSIIERQEAAEKLGPIEFSGQSEDALHLKKVAVSCAPNPNQQLLLDNRVHEQRVGYTVLMPCRLLAGRTLLVSRGWIAAGSSRDVFPNIEIDASSRDRFTGYFAIPGEGFRLGEALDDNDTSWPRRVQYADFDAIGRALSEQVVRGIFHLDKNDPLTLTYHWEPIAFGPEKHYGYALQWFALMATLLVLYFVLNFKREHPRDSM